MVGSILLIGNFVGYFGVDASPPIPSSTGGLSVPGPTGVVPLDPVTFGAPSVHSAICGDGSPEITEWVPWLSAQVPPRTNQVFLEIVELLDGDVDGGPGAGPAVNATSVCTGAPLDHAPSWYVVLRTPGGTNVAVFSYPAGWDDLGAGAGGVPLENGSTLVLVADPGLSRLSFGLCVFGDLGEPIQQCDQL
ncbi:MAG: hypothetical protein ACREC5_00290 [Thermoplasmata archaeon]